MSGRCRIRTCVDGSEARKDIQTTPIAQQQVLRGFPFQCLVSARHGSDEETSEGPMDPDREAVDDGPSCRLELRFDLEP